MKTGIYSKIPTESRDAFLEELLDAYVDGQGLGSMPKPDLDALIVHLYCKYAMNGRFDSFELSQIFKIRESRVKSLIHNASVKFDSIDESGAWVKISKDISKSRFEVDSLERAQVRFKLENPALHRFLQKRVRKHEGTITYSASTEAITINLQLLFIVLDEVYDSSQSEFNTDDMDEIRPLIEKTITAIGKSLGKKRLKELLAGEAKGSKLGVILDGASKLSGIGGLILALI